MALTTEQLLLQMEILANKTDEKTNPNMVYKSNAMMNKGLDPEYFTGQNTKIVNAINMLADQMTEALNSADKVSNKINNLLLNTDDVAGNSVWEETQDLMERPTIIEGIKHILEGKQQDKILGVTVEDIGKILSIAQDTEGNLVVEPIPAGGFDITSIDAHDIAYTNAAKPEVKSVGDVLDIIVNTNQSVNWESIENKPAIATGLELTTEALVLKENENDMSKIDLVTDEDINSIVNNL